MVSFAIDISLFAQEEVLLFPDCDAKVQRFFHSCKG